LNPFDVISYFFEVFPVDLGDLGFELVEVFFAALFVWGLAVRAAIVREV
jgi:hypothetical protein